MAARLLPSLAHLLLCHAALLHEVFIGECYLYGVEVFALNVFHERHLHDVLVVYGAYVCRNSLETGKLRCSPAALSGNDLELAVFHLSEGDGLHYSELLDAVGEFFECCLVKLAARLVGVGFYLVYGHLVDG